MSIIKMVGDAVWAGTNLVTSFFRGIYTGHNRDRLREEVGYKRRRLAWAINKYEEQLDWYGKNCDKESAKILLNELDTKTLRAFYEQTY